MYELLVIMIRNTLLERNFYLIRILCSYFQVKIILISWLLVVEVVDSIGGGGGAGGYRTNTSYQITIGAGGVGSRPIGGEPVPGTHPKGIAGGDTTFNGGSPFSAEVEVVVDLTILLDPLITLVMLVVQAVEVIRHLVLDMEHTPTETPPQGNRGGGAGPGWGGGGGGGGASAVGVTGTTLLEEMGSWSPNVYGYGPTNPVMLVAAVVVIMELQYWELEDTMVEMVVMVQMVRVVLELLTLAVVAVAVVIIQIIGVVVTVVLVS